MQRTPSNEIKKPVLLSKASKRIKYLGINLTREVMTSTLKVLIYCRGSFSSDWEDVAQDWKTHTVGMAN